jgi:hypothetical protein
MWRLLVVLFLILLGTSNPVRDVAIRVGPQCVLAAMPYTVHTPSSARADPVLTSYTLEERLPSWAQGHAIVIGRHAFYSPDESSPAGGGALPSLASLAKVVLGALQC